MIKKSSKWTLKRRFCMTKFTKMSSSCNARNLNKKSTKSASWTRFCTILSNSQKYDSKRWSNFFFFDYVSLNVEFNVFMKDDIMIVIYVNDLIFTKFDLAVIFWLKNALNERFEMSDLNSCIYYLDIMIFKNRHLRLLILNQNVYVKQMLRDHEMWDCKSLIIFMNVSCRLIKIFDEYTVDKNLKINYQSIVRSLMYIMLKTRFDITYFISMISRYVFNLIQNHCQAIKRIFRYLRKTH
jgi:hypothetical protein